MQPVFEVRAAYLGWEDYMIDEIEQKIEVAYTTFSYGKDEKEWIWYLDTYEEAMQLWRQLKKLKELEVYMFRHSKPDLVA